MSGRESTSPERPLQTSNTGNLRVLNDGRVAFIDFGIVGGIPRETANAMLDFVKVFPARVVIVRTPPGVWVALIG